MSDYEIELTGDLVLENEYRKLYFKKIECPRDLGLDDSVLKDYDIIIFLEVKKENANPLMNNMLSRKDAKKLGEFLINFANEI